MSDELQKIRETLSCLGLSQTLDVFENELKTRRISNKTEASLLVSNSDEKPPLPPLTIAQPVILPLTVFEEEEEKESIKDEVLDLGTPNPVSGSPIEAQGSLDSTFQGLPSLKPEGLDFEDDPNTPVSFSGHSWTSNASTVIVNPPLVPSPGDSPFAWQTTASDDVFTPTSTTGLENWPVSNNQRQSLEFDTSISQDSFARVNSLNETESKTQNIFSLAPELTSESKKSDKIGKLNLFSRHGTSEQEISPFFQPNKHQQSTDGDIAFPQLTTPKENFSFQPTPPGSDTGTGAAFMQMSKLYSRSYSDPHSLESGTNSSKHVSAIFANSSSATSSALDPLTTSSHSTEFEYAKEGENVDAEQAKKSETMKRVSLTLSKNALEWGSILDNKPTVPTVQEQDQSLLMLEDKQSRRFSQQEKKFSFPLYPFSQEYINNTYDLINLRIYHTRGKTGFESSKDLYVDSGDVIAGRYQVIRLVGSAVFSKAIKALDLKANKQVCLKMVKNVKDYFDQSLDEIKLLRYLNDLDPADKQGIVRLLDFFYYREHLFLVFELLDQNLYEIQQQSLRICMSSNSKSYYFSIARIQNIAYQLLIALCFLHENNIIHSDLKPENILMQDLERCKVKIIDLGSSCFVTDYLGSYVQSRSYRAPEVILGVPYDQKVDLWSLGCILTELFTGHVLFQTSCLAELMLKIENTNGPVPEWMIKEGKFSDQYYTASGKIFRKASNKEEEMEILELQPCGIFHTGRKQPDEKFEDFISNLLTIDPHKRPTAMELLKHPWIMHQY